MGDIYSEFFKTAPAESTSDPYAGFDNNPDAMLPAENDTISGNFNSPNSHTTIDMVKQYFQRVGRSFREGKDEIAEIITKAAGEAGEFKESTLYKFIETLSYPRNWLVAQEMNILNALKGNIKDDEQQAFLTEQVLMGVLTPEEAVREGLYISADPFNIDWNQAVNWFRSIAGESTQKSKFLDSDEKIGVDILRDSSYPLKVNISEEQLWRTMLGDKLFDVLDNLSIVTLPGMFNQAEQIRKKADVSIADGLRFMSFIYNDPLAIGTVGLDIAGHALTRSGKATKVFSVESRASCALDDLKRYVDWRSAELSDFMLNNPAATQRDVDAYASGLKSFNVFQDELYIQSLREGTNRIIPSTPGIRKAERAVNEAIENGEPFNKIAELRANVNILRDKVSRIDITSKENIRHLDEVLEEFIESYRRDPYLRKSYDDIIVGDKELWDRINAELKLGRPTYEIVNQMRSMMTADDLEKFGVTLQNLDKVRIGYRAVRGKLSRAGLSASEIDKRMQEMWANMVIGVDYTKAGVTKPSTLLKADDWYQLSILPDDDVVAGNLMRHPKVQSLVKTIRGGDIQPYGSGDLSILSPFWRDPYFYNGFNMTALRLQEAELAMVDYAAKYADDMNTILEGVAPRLRDRTNVLGDPARAGRRDMYGRAVSFESFIDPAEAAKYITIDGKPITEMQIREITMAVNRPVLRSIDSISREIKKLDIEIDNLERLVSGARDTGVGHSKEIDLVRALNRRESLGRRLRAFEARLRPSSEALDAALRGELTLPVPLEGGPNTGAARALSKGRFDFDVTGYINRSLPGMSDDDVATITQIREFVGQLWNDLLKADPDAAEAMSGRRRNLATLIQYLQEDRNATRLQEFYDINNRYFEHLDVDAVRDPKAAHHDIFDPLRYAFNAVNRKIHYKNVTEEVDLLLDNAIAAGEYNKANYLKVIRDRINGVPTSIDRQADAMWYAAIKSNPILTDNVKKALLDYRIMRPTAAALFTVRGFYRGALLANPGFAIKNLFGSVNTMGKYGGMRTMRATWQFLNDPENLAKQASLTYDLERFFAANTERSKVLRTLTKSNMWTEYFNRGIAFWTGIDMELERMVTNGVINEPTVDAARKAGLLEYVTRVGRDAAFETQHIYDVFGKPSGMVNGVDILGSKTIRPAIQFVNYWPKQTDFMVRMFKDKQYGSFTRFILMSGWLTRVLTDSGIDATEFVGAGYGAPDISAPATDLVTSFVDFISNSVISHDLGQAERDADNFIRGLSTLTGGSMGLPMSIISRGLTTADRSADNVLRSLDGDYVASLTDSDRIWTSIGLPTVRARNRHRFAQLMVADQQMRSLKLTNMVRVLTGLEEERTNNGELTDDQQQLYDNILDEIESTDLWLTKDKVRAAVKAENIDVTTRQLLRSNYMKWKYYLDYLNIAENELIKYIGEDAYNEMRLGGRGDYVKKQLELIERIGRGTEESEK